MQTLQCRSGLYDVHHAPALHDYFSAELIRGINDLLHTVHIGCKGRNDDSRILVLRKETVEGPPHCLFGRGKSQPFRIGRITHEREHALPADLCKTLQINGITENRRIIHFKIAGVYHNARRRIDRQCSGIHNAVIRFNKFNSELSQIDGLPELHYLAFRPGRQIMLRQFVLNNAHRQPRCIDRNIQFLQYIRQRTDMIFVSMGDNKSFYFIRMFLQISNIRDHEIYSQHLIFRKRQPAIHHNNAFFILKGSNIKPNLLQTA